MHQNTGCCKSYVETEKWKIIRLFIHIIIAQVEKGKDDGPSAA